PLPPARRGPGPAVAPPGARPPRPGAIGAGRRRGVLHAGGRGGARPARRLRLRARRLRAGPRLLAHPRPARRRPARRRRLDLPRYWPKARTWTAPLPAVRRRPAGLPPPLSVDDDSPRALAFHPVIVGEHVLVADARRVTAYDLATGRPAAQYDLAPSTPEAAA